MDGSHARHQRKVMDKNIELRPPHDSNFKIMTPIAGTVKYPIKYCCLLLCILLLSSFELWGHFYPSSAHNWNIAKVHEISVGDPSNFSFAVFGDNKGTKFAK